MDNVVQFPKHRLWRGSKMVVCMTCLGVGDALPTHCPMVAMDSAQELLIKQRSADYVDGEWRWYGYVVREVK